MATRAALEAEAEAEAEVGGRSKGGSVSLAGRIRAEVRHHAPDPAREQGRRRSGGVAAAAAGRRRRRRDLDPIVTMRRRRRGLAGDRDEENTRHPYDPHPYEGYHGDH